MIPTRNISTTVVVDGLVKEEAVACRRQNNREIERLRANVKESTENTEMVMKMSGENGWSQVFVFIRYPDPFWFDDSGLLTFC